MVACTSPKRYWDDVATRTEHRIDPTLYTGNGYTKGSPQGILGNGSMPGNPAGAPLLDWWEITASGYKGAHYAVYPPELVVRLVKAMCPRRVCVTCGEPSRRIVEVSGTSGHDFMGKNNDRGLGHQGERDPMPKISRVNTGWTDCGHDNWRNGVTLDPFAGSGTTLVVAHGHGRDSIGIDLDPRNRDLTQQRLGGLIPLTEGVTA